jgi:hypothetical protein
LRRRQGDVHDRGVQRGHEMCDGDDGQCEPPAVERLRRLGSAAWLLVISFTSLSFRSGRGELRDGAGDGVDVGGLPWPTAGDEHDVVHAEGVQGAAAVDQVLGGLVG